MVSDNPPTEKYFTNLEVASLFSLYVHYSSQFVCFLVSLHSANPDHYFSGILGEDNIYKVLLVPRSLLFCRMLIVHH